MEYMSLAGLIQYGTPVLLFALVILAVVLLMATGYLRGAVKELDETIKDLKNKLVWVSNCEKTHAAVDKRLDDHEARLRELERNE